jgi:hypothetical protein
MLECREVGRRVLGTDAAFVIPEDQFMTEGMLSTVQ